MKVVLLEIQKDGEWRTIGSVSELEPPGSISSEEPGGRQVYSFGWLLGSGPGVWRSVAGADLENEAVRLVVSTGYEIVAELTDWPCELSWWRWGEGHPVRFRVGEVNRG